MLVTLADEITVDSKFRDRLKRYEAEGVQIDVKQDRLIEIRFFNAGHRTYTSPSAVVRLTQFRNAQY